MSDDRPPPIMPSGASAATSPGQSVDLTDRLFHGDALALAEQSAGIGVWSIDLAAGVVHGTAQFFRIMGLPPTDKGVPVDALRALRHPDDGHRVLAGFRNVLEGGSDAYEMEYRVVRPDGELRWIFGRGRVVRDERGTPVRYSGVDIDVTDRKAAQAELAAAKDALEQLNRALEQRVRERTAELEAEAERRAQAEARLHQAQKMEAVGQLTGGLAHDFNNILQVIVGNLEIAARILDATSFEGEVGVRQKQVRGAIATARRASQSARDLVLRMLAFSRLQTLEPGVLDMNTLIAGMHGMIARTLGETIVVEIRGAPGLWTAHADRNQLETALLNLVVNARDAMGGGGRLTIETANLHVDAGAVDDLPAGDYVVLRVDDTGCGIPPEVLPRVFEPFFTTKDTGKGSGLGLSMVYGFVSQSGGHVRIDSHVGAGTSVRVFLPRERTDNVPPAATSGAMADRGAAAVPRAKPGETILLVEDNRDVRGYVVAALEDLGYVVVEAADARAALALLDDPSTPRIDALFTDIVLPGGMSGIDLAAEVRTKRPEVPVLYTSGYAAGRGRERGDVNKELRVLAKPYRTEALASALRKTIDAATPRPPPTPSQ